LGSESVAQQPLQEAIDLLGRARELLGDEGGEDDLVVRSAVHLIDCAIDVSTVLAAHGGGLEAARVALGSARSAVVAATCAVRHTHDRTKTKTVCPGPLG
jgi:hypothetical protein